MGGWAIKGKRRKEQEGRLTKGKEKERSRMKNKKEKERKEWNYKGKITKLTDTKGERKEERRQKYNSCQYQEVLPYYGTSGIILSR